MKNLFNSIKLAKPKKNRFDLTHDVKMTGNMGQLMPCCLVESVPGDSFQLSSETFIRFAPMLAPIMHRVDCTVHYFFVPNRIIWDNWEKFIINEPNVTLPYITIDETLTPEQNAFIDYFGVPPFPAGGYAQNVSALPFAAYQMIYNEYYRDENLIPEVKFALTDGDNNSNYDLLTMRNRAWEHDYFTACLPWAQKGAAVDIPLGDVELKNDWAFIGNNPPKWVDSFDQVQPGQVVNQAINTGYVELNPGAGPTTAPAAYDPEGSLTVQPTTINELRRAFRLQEWLEKNARGGTRYIEQILAHFGVKSSDARLNRPEYITGIKTPVVISEVLNTTGETSGLPQGNMAGHGVAVSGSYTGKYYTEEHGYIVGIMSVLPKPAYQQGIPNTFLKTDPLEWYWPSFAHIGEQEVKVAELYAYDFTSPDTFGYIPRYSEYKYLPNRVVGEFRNTLDYWHLGRKFANAPTLSQEFIECDPAETTRIFNVEDPGTEHLYIQVVNKISAVRPMPVFGTPML